MNTRIEENLKRLEIPGKLTFLEGNGELTKMEVRSEWSTAEIYLHGAHITDFQKRGEPPVLFRSSCSRFNRTHPIRGGIPIVFPWFGAREGEPMHGFARISEWQLHEAIAVPKGGVSLRFSLPETAESGIWPSCAANYVVTVTDTLTLELIITNTSPDEAFLFENCFHTYFAVGHLADISISGLHGCHYLDKVENFAQKTDPDPLLRLTTETDRIYVDAPQAVEILDPTWHRKIQIDKAGSSSTVVWNPGPIKGQQIPDLGMDDYLRMVCVETGNVGPNRIVLPPGESSLLHLKIATLPLA